VIGVSQIKLKRGEGMIVKSRSPENSNKQNQETVNILGRFSAQIGELAQHQL
jgi:hypothetical protein